MIGTSQASLTKESTEIIKAVLYFDVFKYPLSRKELFENSAINLSFEQFNTELDLLLASTFVKEENGFIMCPDRTSADLSRRMAGNAGAKEIMPTAFYYSKKIASFPFVEGVCLSGALSKNYYDESGDIDFFIITKPNRLWIARSLLILNYKFLPERLKKFWCVNYFISSDNLVIPDINVFTGTELAYLIPTVNYSLYTQLLDANIWYKERFPNKQRLSNEACLEKPSTALKSFMEYLLGASFGAWLDNRLLSLTHKRWRKKYRSMSDADFNLQFRSRKDVCKRHTLGFQNKVIILWEEKIRLFEENFNTSLSRQSS